MQDSAAATLRSKRLLQDIPAAADALTITSDVIALRDAELAAPYRADLDAAFTYSSPTGLPDGLQLGNSSIKGIPKFVGTYNITISATSKGRTDLRNYRLVVKPMELVVAGNFTIYTDATTELILIVRGGFAPINLTVENGPDFCTLQEYKLVCTPIEVGVFTVGFLLVDRVGNTVHSTLKLNAVVDPNVGAKRLEMSASKVLAPDNPTEAHNAVLLRFPSKCRNTSKEYYSGIKTVAVLSLDHQRLTLVGGALVILQACTTRVFVATIQVRDFQAGSKVVFAGVPDAKIPNRYVATKILKVRDP